jgi:hypothetical protein
MWRGEAGGSHCLREAGWRGRDKSIRFPPMPAAARDRITARRAPKNAEKAEPVLRGSVTRWCYGSSLRPTVARARRDDEEVGSRVRTCARSGTDIVRPGVGDRQGSMLAYALIGSEERSALPTVALSVRGEDLSVARGETDRDRAVFACRLRRTIGENVRRERSEACQEHVAPQRADRPHVAISGRRGSSGIRPPASEDGDIPIPLRGDLERRSGLPPAHVLPGNVGGTRGRNLLVAAYSEERQYGSRHDDARTPSGPRMPGRHARGSMASASRSSFSNRLATPFWISGELREKYTRTPTSFFRPRSA